jgi:alpha-tubulin suppressor-like RCC1 family protein
VTVGSGFACALGQDGSLWCWGDNTYGETGTTASSTPVLTPVQVGTLKSWFMVSAGAYHACAIEEDTSSNGDLWCWGRDDSGQVGSGVVEMSAPITQIGATTSWALVGTGDAHTCAVDAGGGLSCWGSNSAGQAGGVTTANIITPTPIVAASVPGWSTLFLGTAMTCAIATTMNSDLYCWGNNKLGMLGLGSLPGTSTPTLVPSTDSSETWNWDSQDVIGQQTFAGAAADTHVCAIQSDGSLFCWGEDIDGEFGDGVTPPLVPTPVTAPQLGPQTGDWLVVATGHDFTCGLQEELEGNAAFCFGLNNIGQLGDGLAWFETPNQQP